jgi:hypothetical protein
MSTDLDMDGYDFRADLDQLHAEVAALGDSLAVEVRTKLGCTLHDIAYATAMSIASWIRRPSTSCRAVTQKPTNSHRLPPNSLR